MSVQNLKELRSAEEEEESQEDIATYVCYLMIMPQDTL